jgi:hypothetical protein
MCIAILNKPNQFIKRKHLKNCWDNNGDGAGLAYVSKKGNISIFKELDNFDTFYDRYKYVRDRNPESNMLIHFRIKTHGNTDKTNCHPFKVNDGLVFCHNGIISEVKDSDRYSDTIMFNHTVLRKLPDGFIYSDSIKSLISKYIGSSKLVFLTSKNEAYIINEHFGEHTKKGWFSNDSWKQKNNFVYAGNRKIYNNYGGRGYNPYGYDEYDDFYAPSSSKSSSSNWNADDDNALNDEDNLYSNCGHCSSYLCTESEEKMGSCELCYNSIIEAAWDYDLIDEPDFYTLTSGTLITPQLKQRLKELAGQVEIAAEWDNNGKMFMKADVVREFNQRRAENKKKEKIKGLFDDEISFDGGLIKD